MRLLILSDLHLEFAPITLNRTDADVVILAGDTRPGIKGLSWARDAFPNSEVVYILGNHEYYGQAIPRHSVKLKELAQGSHIHVLENDALILGDVIFLGCTLWTDFELFGNPRIAGYFATQDMNDYRRIHVSPSYRKLRSLDTAGLHHSSRHWLAKQFDQHQGSKIVVVTHHAPSARSLPESYEDDILYAASASHMDDIVETSRAVLWVHGHRHVSYDYFIGSTHIICNPRGYSNQPNPDFQADCIVNV